MAHLKKTHTNKKIHDHLIHIAHINTGLAALSLLFLLVFFIWVQWFYTPQQNTEVQKEAAPEKIAVPTAKDNSTEKVAEEYRTTINTLLASIDFEDAAQAEDISYQVLELTVPGELKQFHVQVVVALNMAQQGKGAQAKQRIETLKSEYAWFLPDNT